METSYPEYNSEQLSFFQLFTRQYIIEIPIIQRDYAQGRKSSREIRELFLADLFMHLDTDSKMDLDFVYGSLTKGTPVKFIPLDGQQRLTTLFLLHWYLANKEGRIDHFRSYMVYFNRSRFTYETRASSREFCDVLVLKDTDFDGFITGEYDEQRLLSDAIRDCAWYFLSWENDPTIKAMLLMLDEIHKKFAGSAGFYANLIDPVHPTITFQFLNLEDFKLTDDLYIKMNARGKALTDFENFKAKFEQHMKNIGLDRGAEYTLVFNSVPRSVSALLFFSHKIDTDWANLFWNYKDEKSNTYDEQLMNLFRVIATCHYTCNPEKSGITEKINLLRNNRTAIPFSEYLALECFDKKYVDTLFGILGWLENDNKEIRIYLNNEDSFYYREKDIFSKAIQNNLTYTENIQFFAFYQYLIYNGSAEGISDWVRIIHNLAVNTIYNEAEDYRSSMRSVVNLLPVSNNIREFLSDGNSVFGFYGLQIEEERVKAMLILKDQKWKKKIIEIEKHGYFKGQIGFLMNFSGMWDHEKDKSWSEDEDQYHFELFNQYIQKACSVIGAKGVKEFDSYLWERALLCKGNYLLRAGKNLSLLKNDDRDLSWKRLLRNDNEGKRGIVKAVFDDALFDIDNPEMSLTNIIKNYVPDGTWRSRLIANPGAIDYCKQRMIRELFDGYIVLMSQSQLNHYHAELRSYCFYLNYVKGQIDKFQPFCRVFYSDVKTSEDSPGIIIGDHQYLEYNLYIFIYYDSPIDHAGLTLGDKNGKKLPFEIGEKAESCGFEESENSYIYETQSEQELLRKITLLCSLLKNPHNQYN